eukprot:4512438-Amphidinium_carterae.1
MIAGGENRAGRAFDGDTARLKGRFGSVEELLESHVPKQTSESSTGAGERSGSGKANARAGGHPQGDDADKDDEDGEECSSSSTEWWDRDPAVSKELRKQSAWVSAKRAAFEECLKQADSALTEASGMEDGLKHEHPRNITYGRF